MVSTPHLPPHSTTPLLAEPPAPVPSVAPARMLSPRRMVAIALLAAGIVFCVSATLDWVLVREHDSRNVAIEVSDTLGAAIAGILVFRLLQYERERRARLRQRVEMIADMNHHVRNALQVISLSAYSSDNRQELAAIRDSVNRIQWALREILPKI